jgi:hypothetical protein
MKAQFVLSDEELYAVMNERAWKMVREEDAVTVSCFMRPTVPANPTFCCSYRIPAVTATLTATAAERRNCLLQQPQTVLK